MIRIALLAGGGLLLLATPALAQNAADGSAPPPAGSTEPEAAADPAPVPAPETMLGAPEPGREAGVAAGASTDQYSDQQITGFVRAMTAIQALAGDDAARQAQAIEIVSEAGIDAATYNAIGTTMQIDPALADRVRTAMAAEQGTAGV